MRIIVVSDTHGDLYSLKKAVLRQPNAEVIIHCGDGEEQAEYIKMMNPDKMVISVRGNCDWGSMLKPMEIINIEGKRILITHGHLFDVKMTKSLLIEKARDEKIDIVVYGHTHIPDQTYDDGLYILNPGSCSGYGATYGYIDITDSGIVTNVVKVI